jgi:hypothetical protein
VSSEAEAERRQLTVMFCDLVRSTARSNAMGPEHLAVLVTTFSGDKPACPRHVRLGGNLGVAGCPVFAGLKACKTGVTAEVVRGVI